ncbi:hypothetical protein BH20VER2_BH20VER2_13350 [soil metagenome]
MDEETTTNDPKKNPDPLTGAPGARQVATGVGAAGGGLTGAAVGAAVGGPVGAAVGAVIGGVAGGYAGKGVAEAIDPTVEDKYWREHHSEQEWADENSTYEQYEPAYRAGYEGLRKYPDREYEEVEPELQRDYEASEANQVVPWARARPALKASWRRVVGIYGPRDRARGMRGGI